jgi:hypothetical protein
MKEMGLGYFMANRRNGILHPQLLPASQAWTTSRLTNGSFDP